MSKRQRHEERKSATSSVWQGRLRNTMQPLVHAIAINQEQTQQVQVQQQGPITALVPFSLGRNVLDRVSTNILSMVLDYLATNELALFSIAIHQRRPEMRAALVEFLRRLYILRSVQVFNFNSEHLFNQNWARDFLVHSGALTRVLRMEKPFGVPEDILRRCLNSPVLRVLDFETEAWASGHRESVDLVLDELKQAKRLECLSLSFASVRLETRDSGALWRSLSLAGASLRIARIHSNFFLSATDVATLLARWSPTIEIIDLFGHFGEGVLVVMAQYARRLKQVILRQSDSSMFSFSNNPNVGLIRTVLAELPDLTLLSLQNGTSQPRHWIDFEAKNHGWATLQWDREDAKKTEWNFRAWHMRADRSGSRWSLPNATKLMEIIEKVAPRWNEVDIAVNDLHMTRDLFLTLTDEKQLPPIRSLILQFDNNGQDMWRDDLLPWFDDIQVQKWQASLGHHLDSLTIIAKNVETERSLRLYRDVEHGGQLHIAFTGLAPSITPWLRSCPNLSIIEIDNYSEPIVWYTALNQNKSPERHRILRITTASSKASSPRIQLVSDTLAKEEFKSALDKNWSTAFSIPLQAGEHDYLRVRTEALIHFVSRSDQLIEFTDYTNFYTLNEPLVQAITRLTMLERIHIRTMLGAPISSAWLENLKNKTHIEWHGHVGRDPDSKDSKTSNFNVGLDAFQRFLGHNPHLQVLNWISLAASLNHLPRIQLHQLTFLKLGINTKWIALQDLDRLLGDCPLLQTVQIKTNDHAPAPVDMIIPTRREMFDLTQRLSRTQTLEFDADWDNWLNPTIKHNSRDSNQLFRVSSKSLRSRWRSVGEKPPVQEWRKFERFETKGGGYQSDDSVSCVVRLDIDQGRFHMRRVREVSDMQDIALDEKIPIDQVRFLVWVDDEYDYSYSSEQGQKSVLLDRVQKTVEIFTVRLQDSAIEKFRREVDNDFAEESGYTIIDPNTYLPLAYYNRDIAISLSDERLRDALPIMYLFMRLLNPDDFPRRLIAHKLFSELNANEVDSFKRDLPSRARVEKVTRQLPFLTPDMRSYIEPALEQKSASHQHHSHQRPRRLTTSDQGDARLKKLTLSLPTTPITRRPRDYDDETEKNLASLHHQWAGEMVEDEMTHQRVRALYESSLPLWQQSWSGSVTRPVALKNDVTHPSTVTWRAMQLAIRHQVGHRQKFDIVMTTGRHHDHHPNRLRYHYDMTMHRHVFSHSSPSTSAITMPPRVLAALDMTIRRLVRSIQPLKSSLDTTITVTCD